jgi:hypothetical protein
MVPVNLRPPEQADDLGNRFGLVSLALPLPVASPLARFRLVKERMDALKRSPEPLVSFQVLSALGLAPPEVAHPLVNLFGSKATAVVTNVMGPRSAIYLCGRRVRDVMFWVPQSGRMGLGLSILSYDGRVRVGVATDRHLVPDPENVAEDFDAELAALVEWASADEQRAAAAPKRVRGGSRAQAGAVARSRGTFASVGSAAAAAHTVSTAPSTPRAPVLTTRSKVARSPSSARKC